MNTAAHLPSESGLEFVPLLQVGAKVFSDGRPPERCRIGHGLDTAA